MVCNRRVLSACLALAPTTALPSAYQTLKSEFSNNTIRLKSWPADDIALCNGGAAHHAGWADIGDRHLFYWFHEARNGRNAPLMIWHQGGPGGSSLHGMLYENGPCLSDGSNATKFNPYSWTVHFNVIYLDQPAGVGLSYLDEEDDDSLYPSRTEDSSLDAVAFVRLVYEAFPHLAAVDLHLAGESYAGRYVSSFASAILEYNQFFVSNPRHSESGPTIPLRSIMIGNPWISPLAQIPSMYDVSCFEYRNQFLPHLDEEDCARALKVVDRCEAVLRACFRGRGDSVLCAQPHALCQDQFVATFQNITRSIYDRRLRKCPEPGNCYLDLAGPQAYLNSKEVLDNELEVPVQTGGRRTSWDMMSQAMLRRYTESGDFYTPAIGDIKKILDYSRKTVPAKGGRPVDVLVYVGVADIICNADGVFDALRQVQWEGRAPFRAVPWAELPWQSASGGRGGRVKAVPNLWLVEVEEAGHMVPHDQPLSSLKLIEYWLDHIFNTDGHSGGRLTEASSVPPPNVRDREEAQVAFDDSRATEL